MYFALALWEAFCGVLAVIIKCARCCNNSPRVAIQGGRESYILSTHQPFIAQAVMELARLCQAGIACAVLWHCHARAIVVMQGVSTSANALDVGLQATALN